MHETATSPALHAGTRLGERVRSLRVSAGLTQTELAGERFSKEYISQIERGKTRPTETTVAWLAEEVGELARAARKGTADEQLHELGDVLAWLASLANQLGLSMDEALARYADGCPVCLGIPCTCPAAG